MEVNKELIEKYHLNLCTLEEKAIVEAWLDADESDDILLMSETGKSALKNDIWAGIEEILPATQEETKTVKLHAVSVFKQAVAASLIIGLIGLLGALWVQSNSKSEPVSVNNAEAENETVQISDMNVILTPQSHARISSSSYLHNGNIDFCGMILIDPKKDFELTLKTNCTDPGHGVETVKLKKGQKYIAINYHFNSSNELIVVNQENLINLPPLLQRELIEKFKI